MLDRRAAEGSASLDEGATLIAIVDYGAGNLRSVCNALDVLGKAYRIATAPQDLNEADGILLPGVGHFGQMLGSLETSHLAASIRAEAEEGTPLLGICLGMQALFDSSEEALGVPGLGLMPGQIKRFANVPRIPHMGWNEVRIKGGESHVYYFANSYYAPLTEYTTGTCDYGHEFAAIVRHKNVSGVQFHPEKSGEAGLKLLMEWCRAC
jgi:imidazole glycerol phosphate synthase glutamine amidotransferase subunit